MKKYFLLSLLFFWLWPGRGLLAVSPVNMIGLNAEVNVNMDELKQVAKEEAGKQVKQIRGRLANTFNIFWAWLKKFIINIWNLIKDVIIKVRQWLNAVFRLATDRG